MGGLSNLSIDPQSDCVFVSFKFPTGLFSPSEGSAAGRATSTARVDFDYHGLSLSLSLSLSLPLSLCVSLSLAPSLSLTLSVCLLLYTRSLRRRLPHHVR